MTLKKQVTSIICSKPSLFSKLSLLSCKILQSCNLVPKDENFPSRREHFQVFLSYELQAESFNDLEETEKIILFAILIPCMFTSPCKETMELSKKARYFSTSTCTIPVQDLSFDKNRVEKFLQKKLEILEIFLQKDTNVILQFQELTGLSFGDILYIVHHLPTEYSWNELTEEKKNVLLMQKNVYWFKNPSQTSFSIPYFFGYLPSTNQGNEQVHQMKQLLESYEPWAGPYSQENLSMSLWKHKTSNKIMTYNDMIKEFPSFTNNDFDYVKVLIHEKETHTNSIEEEILQKCYSSQFPKTFSILPDKDSFPVLYESLEEYSAKATDEEVLAVLFQLIWTIAVLQLLYPGFQHNSLAKSIKLVKYPKHRCYRVASSSYVFHISSDVPLPVISSFDTCTSFMENSKIPQRKEKIFDPKYDTLEICRVVSDKAVGKELMEICENTNIQNVLFHELFDSFLSKQGPKSLSIAMIENL
jgi:hypothetical protein